MIDKNELVSAVNHGNSYRNIAKMFNVAPTTIRHYLSKYGLKTKGNSIRRSPVWINDLPNIVLKSTTMSDVLRSLNLQIRPGNYETVNKWCAKLNISLTHFIGKGHGRTVPTNRISNDKMFMCPSNTNRNSLKRRIIKNTLLPYICSECGSFPVWNNKKLTLVLDHINGNRLDCRIENLRFLCPNCNSQQPTFCRKRTIAV